MKPRMSLNQAAKKKCGRPKKNIDLSRVIELMKKGKTDQEIAVELGVSVRTFRTFRKEYGIPPTVGHGGARQGAGRKKITGGPYDPYMERQQAIDARVNSIDARLRVGKRDIYDAQWLKWAGSAYEFNQGQKQYVCNIHGFGLPAAIRQKGCFE